MNKPSFSLGLGFAFFFLFSVCAHAAAPNLFTYQGRLKESGQAITGNRAVEIFLCNAGTAGTCTTTGAQPVAVSNGLFRSTFTIPSEVNFGTGSWWLEIKVGLDTLAPRERLTSNAYALFAATAAYAENLAAATGSDGVYVSTNLFVTGDTFSLGNNIFKLESGKIYSGTGGSQGQLEINTTSSPQLLLMDPSGDVTLAMRYSSGPTRYVLGVPYYNDRAVITTKSAPFPGTKDPYIKLWDAGNVDIGVVATGYIRLEGGNVGISSSTPLYRLVVSSGAGEAGNMLVISTGSSNVISMTGAGEIFANKYYGDGSQLQNLPASGGAVQKIGDTMTGDLFMSDGSSISVTGAIGIATAAPSAQLAIQYEWPATTDIIKVWEPGAGYTFGLDKNAHLYYGPYLNYGSGSIINFGGNRTQIGSGAVMFHLYPQSVDPGGYLLKAQEGADTRLVVDSEGRVGVGTALPASRFEVAGGSINISGAEAGLLFDGAARKIAPTTDSSVGAGLYVSTNVYTLGFSSATKYYGDGSGLTGVITSTAAIVTALAGKVGTAGDESVAGVKTFTGTVDASNLCIAGNCKSSWPFTPGSQVLLMGTYAVNSSSHISAAAYQVLGSTALAASSALETVAAGIGAGARNGGTANTFAGHNAGYFNTTGADNTFLGRGAGFNNLTGGQNIFAGKDAGILNESGSANVLLGYEAASVSAGVSSSTILGYRAGFNLDTGNDNILIGFRAGDNLMTGGRNIIIGYDQDATASTISDELNIGGLLRGNLGAGTIGIGFLNTLPLAALDLRSTGTASNILAQVWRNGDGAVVSSMTSTGLLVVSSVTASGSIQANTLQVGSSASIRKLRAGSFTFDPGNIVAGSCISEGVVLTGAESGDHVIWTAPPSIETGLVWSSYDASLADTIGLRICNVTGASIDPLSGTWRYILIQ